MPDPNRVMFHHQRREAEGKKPFTVAFRRNGNHVDFAFAYCSPRDNFNRKLGRMIAEGRLNKHPISVPAATINGNIESVHTLIQFAINEHTELTGTE